MGRRATGRPATRRVVTCFPRRAARKRPATAPAVPRRAARRRGANARPSPRRPAVVTPAVERRSSCSPFGPRRARYAVRWSLGTREAHRPSTPATAGSGTPAPQGGRDRTRRFILHRFTFESVRAIRYCFVPLAPSRGGTAGQRARAAARRGAGPRGPPRPANTRRETERAECQSERSEKCLQIAVKRGKGWTLAECASFLR